MTWYDSAFAFKKSIVIPHGNVSGGSDLLNFPVLISVTDSKLAAMLNGGQVYSLIGYDILFTNASETRELAYEIESYNNSTGALLVWVCVPVLSANQDTVLYLYFGNSTVTGYQAVASNVWDKNYKAVYHLEDNAATTTVYDSTSNGMNGTNAANTSTKTTTGEIGSGLAYNGTSDQTTISSLFSSPSSITISAWANCNGGVTSAPDIMWAGSSVGIRINDGVSNSYGLYYNGMTWLPTNVLVNYTGWHHFAYVVDGIGHTQAFYVDGVQVAQTSNASAIVWTGLGSTSAIGAAPGGSHFFPGSIDEARYFSGVRSASWIATEYINQNNPSSFIIAGQTIPLVGNVDISALAALGVTTAQAGVDQINVAGRGANFAVNVALCGVSETFTLKIQGKDGATGQYYTIGSFSGIGSGNSFFTVYPGLNASSTVTDAILPRTWRVTMTPSTADVAAYTVGASLIR